MIKIFCYIKNTDLEKLYQHIKLNNNTIIAQTLTDDIDIAIVDVSFKNSKKHLEYLTKLSNERFLPVIFINFNNKQHSKNINVYSYPFATFLSEVMSEEYVFLQLDKIISVLNKDDDSSLIRLISNKKEIYIRDYNIMYIESARNKTIIHMPFQIIECKVIKISDCKIVLGDNFVKCHRSFAVNKRYINKINITDKILYLNNNQCKVSIGRAYKDLLLEDLGFCNK